MTNNLRTTAAVLGVGAILAGGVAAAGQAFGATTAATGSTTTATVSAADAETTTALTFAREEERMARDLYAAIADRYDGARPFSMITNSEQRHFDAVGALLERYGISDPSAGAKAGTYADATLQKLYDGWWAQAQKSLDEAYQVGIALEQRDIADLEKTIAGNLPADVDTVLGRLLQASQQHLAAFQAAADGELGTGAMNGYRNGNGPGGMMNGGRWGAGNGPGMMNGTGNGPGTGDCPFLDDGDDATT
jgi:hypothetical protein